MTADDLDYTYQTWNPLAWSPDGTRLALERHGVYSWQGDIVLADLSQPCPACTLSVLNGSQDSEYPVWSPDGVWIAASDIYDGNQLLLAADGSEQISITTDDYSSIYGPAWQPLPDCAPADPSAPMAFSGGGDYCAVPTPTPTCIGLPVDRTPTNIRSEPDIAGALLSSFTGDEQVRLHGRYTSMTSERYDDWYRVETAEGVWGWSAAEGVETTPLYDPLCAQMPVYDTPASEPRPPLESEILWPPVGYPEAAAPFYQFQIGSTRQTDDELRIPAPFTQFPSTNTIRLTQGYGLTEFAYLYPGTYTGTNQIHSGLDFFGENPIPVAGCINSEGSPSNSCITVRPVCDGRIVSEGGSASETSGDGFTIRCYMPDGSLSNLYVTYNHIQAGTVGNLLGIEVRLNTTLGLNVFQYTYQSADSEGNPVTKIVAPHLHLEVFYHRGPDFSPETSSTIRLNPLLFFSHMLVQLISDSKMGYYYPTGSYTDTGEEKRYEWDDYDTDDPGDIYALRLAYVRNDPEAPEDYDLGIDPVHNGTFACLGDTFPPVSDPINVWFREEHYPGIQYLGSVPQPETPGQVIRSWSDLVIRLQQGQ